MSIPMHGPKPRVVRGDELQMIQEAETTAGKRPFPERGFWHNATIIHKPPVYEDLCAALMYLRHHTKPTYTELCYANMLSINLLATDEERYFLHWTWEDH